LGGEPELLAGAGIYDIFENPRGLRRFVAERDPNRIGVNMSTAKELFVPEGLHLSDGLSHMDYVNLKKALGEPYASRLVSAEKLISDFRSERVAGEIIEFSKIANITRKLIERALSNEVITSGKTTMNDVCWWLEEKRHALGLESGWHPTVFLSPPDGNEISNTDRPIQPGDVLQIDWGIGRNNFFTDLKRFAYVLKEGETEVPRGIKRAFDESRKIRELVKRNVKSGKTGREQLDNLKQLVAKAGYVYTEEERPRDVDGIEVNIGMHAAGNLGHDVGGSLFEIFPLRTTYEIRPNSLIAFEFIVFTPAAEWGGNKVPVCVEENALITERGIEWVHPPQNRILVIR
jgi:Xaa-Pro aminopeptidase